LNEPIADLTKQSAVAAGKKSIYQTNPFLNKHEEGTRVPRAVPDTGTWVLDGWPLRGQVKPQRNIPSLTARGTITINLDGLGTTPLRQTLVPLQRPRRAAEQIQKRRKDLEKMV